MLNKLTNVPTILRLSLSLLASAGIHGGVACYYWVSQPATVHDGRSAVVVELVSATDDYSFAVDVPKDAPKTSERQNKTVAELQTVPHPPTVPATMSVVKTPPPMPSKSEVASVMTEDVEAPADNPVPPAQICIEPRQSLPDHQAEVASISKDTAASLQRGGDDVPVQEARGVQTDGRVLPESKPATSQAGNPHGGALTEAMPDYRNNPLPEYPLIARKRHWQGVVWLLVDVSEQGLVDDVDLEQSCGYQVLDRAASKAVQSWEFAPAQRAGLPVASQVRIPVRFSLEGS